jgi:hypothetical protein
MIADALAVTVGGVIVLAIIIDVAAVFGWTYRLLRNRGLP